MLNTFPSLLVYWLAAPVLLRATLGILCVYFGIRFLREKHVWLPKLPHHKPLHQAIASFQILLGLALVAGFYTQIVALIVSGASLVALFLKEGSFEKRAFLLLFCTVSLSLLVLGPGFLAFDLPI